MTGAEPAGEPVPALTGGGGLKLGKPVGGVDGDDCDCAEGWAPNPPVDGFAVGVGIAVCVGPWAWFDG